MSKNSPIDAIYRTGESNDEEKFKYRRTNTRIKLNNFKRNLIDKLFPGGKQSITWKDLYKIFKSDKNFKIMASETTIWNKFLDAKRLEDTEHPNPKRKERSGTFRPSDITDDRATFFYNMRKSYETWETKRVPGWSCELAGEIVKKLLIVNGCNCFMSSLILFFTTLVFVASIHPMGEGIFDSSELCKAVMGISAFGFVWYFSSLMGKTWYPNTQIGFVFNIIFMAVCATCCVFFCYILTPAYYEGQGCFKCPSCPETDDKLCFEHSKLLEGINYRHAEANTCFCALEERLRRNQPIIPYGEVEKYCGGNCSCDNILSNSPENWDASQEYFDCVYYSPSGTPLFFFFGAIVILCTSIVVVATCVGILCMMC
jgi:hypothetical protein